MNLQKAFDLLSYENYAISIYTSVHKVVTLLCIIEMLFWTELFTLVSHGHMTLGCKHDPYKSQADNGIMTLIKTWMLAHVCLRLHEHKLIDMFYFKYVDDQLNSQGLTILTWCKFKVKSK